MQLADQEVWSKPGLLVQLHSSDWVSAFFTTGLHSYWPTSGVLPMSTEPTTHPDTLCSLRLLFSWVSGRTAGSLPHPQCYPAPVTPLLVPSFFTPDPLAFLSCQSQPRHSSRILCHFLEKTLPKLQKTPKRRWQISLQLSMAHWPTQLLMSPEFLWDPVLFPFTCISSTPISSLSHPASI